MLLVEVLNTGTATWSLSSRNIDGLELVRGNEVHPYHLMRYDRAIFAQPAIEKLQDSLKKSASRANTSRRAMKARRKRHGFRASVRAEKAAEVA